MREHEIWKFPLDTVSMQTVEMPGRSEILSVDVQAGKIYIWAIVDPNEENIPKTIEIFGTGHPMPNTHRRTFIGTVQANGLVWHVFRLLGI